MTLSDRNGRSVHLDIKLASGGEADIYALRGRGDQVAKIYFRPSVERSEKLAAMISSPPSDPTLSQGHVSICWPNDILLDQFKRNCVGFLMHRADFTKNVPVLELYNPRDRRRVAPGFTWDYLVGTAANIASVVEAVHARGYVVGDINESNFLVSDRALVTLVDCDSMQVPKPGAGFFRCTVGKPDFTPPELQGRDFSQTDRDSTHDNFALGVMVFHLLMEGVHPYAGIWRGAGEPLPQDRIRTGDCPYAGSPLVAPMPGAVPFDILPSPVRALFVRCFGYGHKTPATRPSPREWREALNGLQHNLDTCSANRRHIYPNHLQKCPWCERTVLLRGSDPYPESVQQRPLKTAAFTVHSTAGPFAPVTPPRRPPPPTPTPVPPPPAPVLSREWAIGLGWVAALACAQIFGVLSRALFGVLPQPPSWLNGFGIFWLFGTAALVGVTVTGLLSGRKRRARITASLATALTATLVVLVAFVALVGARAPLVSPDISPSSGTSRLEGRIIGEASSATQLPDWLRALTGQRTISRENFPPPDDFQIHDRCAGEGCGYQRPWIALKQIPLFAAWGQPNSDRVYTVAEREVVTALAGIWITHRPAVLEVEEDIDIGGVELKRGDLIYVLMSLGEGFVRAFFHGKLADFSPDASNNRQVTRKLRNNYDSVLWVQMKTGTGVVGWTSDTAYPSFDGQYKLFTYVVPGAMTEKDGLWDFELDLQAEKPASVRIGTVVVPATLPGSAKVHTGFILRPRETQSIELIANENSELLARAFVEPAAVVNTSASNSPLPTASLSQNLPTVNSLAIATPTGHVAVSNFYHNAKQISLDRTSVLIEETAAYNITFYEPDHSFNIAILKTPFQTSRAQAEAAFLHVLGVSQADACKLNVKVGAPVSVDPEHAGQNLGLEFCKSARQPDSQAPSDGEQVAQLVQQAQSLFEEGRYSVALERCDALLARYPKNLQAIELKRKIERAVDILKR